MNIDKKFNNILFWSFLLIIVLIGIYFRLKGLGKWPLAVDEYYIVKSSQNILKYGIPMWDSGGYYVRGLPQQYLTALLLGWGIKAEFASRIIPVIANLVTIPGLFLLGKKVSGKALAAALVFVFVFSLWEVEFSRFARMYTLFQAIFVWYIYFLYKNVIEKDLKSFKWLLLLSFICIFVYEGSIFLVMLNFIPIFWDRNKNTINSVSPGVFKNTEYGTSKLIFCIGILLFAYAFLTFDFRTLYSENILPLDLVGYFKNQRTAGILRIPVLLIETLPSYWVWSFLFILLLSINFFVFYRLKLSKKSILLRTAVALLIIFSLLNLTGLFLISLILFIAVGWLEPKDLITNSPNADRKWKLFPSKLSLYLISAALINLIFWVSFTVNTSEWHKFFPAQIISGIFPAVKMVIKESINYPYFYETFALFRDTIPISTIVYSLLVGILIIYIVADYYNKNSIKLRFLLLIFLTLVLAQNVLKLTYFDTRYFFFLHPLLLILVLGALEWTINFLIKKIYLNRFLFGTAVIVVVLLSEDFKLNHLIYIDTKEINFRMNFSFPLTIHYYPRYECRTPSEIVNKEADVDDIIITNEQITDYYLNRLDYIFRDGSSVEFRGESVLNGTKERWTNANLIYRYSDLSSFIDNNQQRKWLIINKMWALDDLNSLISKYEKYLYYTSIDGRILLFKIPNSNIGL